jgi:hypothetical protein
MLAQVDLAVIETGLGGVRDATNVFAPEQLQVAIFTAIDLEHVAALGAGAAVLPARARTGPGLMARTWARPVPGAEPAAARIGGLLGLLA